MQRSITRIRDEFIEFEKRTGLTDLRIQDYRIWPDIRLLVFLKVLRESGGLDAFSHLQPAKKLQWILKALPGLFTRNPFLGSRRCDFLVWSNSRRSRQPDGLYWDIYTDPIIDALSCRYRVRAIENTYKGGHLKPSKTKKLLFADIITLLAFFGRRRAKITLQPAEVRRLREIDAEFRRLFDVDIDLVNTVVSHLRNRAACIPLYRRLLKRYLPEAVLLVCSYGKEILIEACKLEGVPTVEIQHGVIGPGHMGYSFSAVGDKPNFPDYLLSFGDYWKENVRFPIPDEHVMSFGFPFLTMNAEKVDTGKTNTILFISQGTIGKSLAQFALELQDRAPSGYSIVYKLHPAETQEWQRHYPELIDSGMRVIDTDTPSLYSLLAESRMLFGVYSTAIYEGLYFGCKVFIVKLPGYEHSLPLVESGAATLVETPDSVAFDRLDTDWNENKVFATGWRANLHKIIDQITSQR